jgi:hypothetical protein
VKGAGGTSLATFVARQKKQVYRLAAYVCFLPTTVARHVCEMANNGPFDPNIFDPKIFDTGDLFVHRKLRLDGHKAI